MVSLVNICSPSLSHFALSSLYFSLITTSTILLVLSGPSFCVYHPLFSVDPPYDILELHSFFLCPVSLFPRSFSSFTHHSFSPLVVLFLFLFHPPFFPSPQYSPPHQGACGTMMVNKWLFWCFWSGWCWWCFFLHKDDVLTQRTIVFQSIFYISIW